MDYYSTLGLKRGASDAEIKKAYRTMAMKHHPDRGGDEAEFKKISEAYDILSDPNKKQMVDSGMDPNNSRYQGGFGGGNPFEFHFDTGNMHDMFSQFGFGGRRAPQRNKSFSVNVELTLEEVLSGKDLNAEVGVPGGKTKVINISIPSGIEHGQQIKYQGMGDDSISFAPPGDLIVNVYVKPHGLYRREGTSLLIEKTISVWDAMLGTSVSIKTLDNKNLDITVPPGTQPETILSCRGEGLPHMRTNQRGNLLIKIKVNIPKNFTADQLSTLRSLKDGV